MSHVAFSGNVAVAPELACTPSGRPFARFVVAENLGHKDASGSWVEDPANFWPVTVWGEWAQHLVDSVHVGDRVTVTGRVRTNAWIDKETGEKRSRFEVTADDVSASLRFARVRIAKVLRSTPADAPEARAGAVGDEPPY